MPRLAELATAIDLPLSADLQNGFGNIPEAAAQTIIAAARAAYSALLRVSNEVLNSGTFGDADEAISAKEINRILSVGEIN